MHTISAESIPENFEKVMEFVRKLIPVEGKVASEIQIVCDEILNNVISYSKAKELSVSVWTDCDCFFVQFSDDGIPFNPLDRESPDVEEDLDKRPIGGLGIFLVRKLMDDVNYEYSDSKNVLTVKKHFLHN